MYTTHGKRNRIKKNSIFPYDYKNVNYIENPVSSLTENTFSLAV